MKKTKVKVEEAPKVKVKLIKIYCSHCGGIKKLPSPNVVEGFGGIKCTSCGKFDDFYGEYEIDGINYSWVTIPTYDIHSDNDKYFSKSRFILQCKNAEAIQNLFKENKYTYAEANNAFAQLGINVGYIKPFYPKTYSEAEIETLKKSEEKLIKHLKKLIK